jgi:hypothetical protein
LDDLKGKTTGWTATLYQVVRKYFYTEESGTSSVARLSITNLDWAKVNDRVEHDDGRVIVPGDVVSYQFAEGTKGWVSKEMTDDLLAACYD